MIPNTNGQDVELFVIQPFYKEQSKRNKEGMWEKTNKFVKEQYLKVWMSKLDLSLYGEYQGSKGEILKKRTTVYNRVTQSYYKVAHSLDEIKEVLHPTKIGFKTK